MSKEDRLFAIFMSGLASAIVLIIIAAVGAAIRAAVGNSVMTTLLTFGVVLAWAIIAFVIATAWMHWGRS